jgi:hypothetical protein
MAANRAASPGPAAIAPATAGPTIRVVVKPTCPRTVPLARSSRGTTSAMNARRIGISIALSTPYIPAKAASKPIDIAPLTTSAAISRPWIAP